MTRLTFDPSKGGVSLGFVHLPLCGFGSESSSPASQVGQGCATALALLFDQDRSVRLVLDQDLVQGDHSRVYFHPMSNAASMGLRPDDLLRFLKATGHEPVLEHFD